jgi:hypothetical protein
MSKQEPQRRQRAERPLSSEYHKAHKQLMLWAGILFIWELVGIDLTKAESAEGNVGAIVRSIKSPQAIPWVLLVLVGYFLFKTSIEWGQCDVERRKGRAARADFISALAVSVLAYALYIFQAISKIQFADALQGSNKFPSVLAGAFSGWFLVLGALILWENYSSFSKSKFILAVGILYILCSIIVPLIMWSIANWFYLLISYAIVTATRVLMNRPWRHNRTA